MQLWLKCDTSGEVPGSVAVTLRGCVLALKVPSSGGRHCGGRGRSVSALFGGMEVF